jgi:hypothetical protein
MRLHLVLLAALLCGCATSSTRGSARSKSTAARAADAPPKQLWVSHDSGTSTFAGTGCVLKPQGSIMVFIPNDPDADGCKLIVQTFNPPGALFHLALNPKSLAAGDELSLSQGGNFGGHSLSGPATLRVLSFEGGRAQFQLSFKPAANSKVRAAGGTFSAVVLPETGLSAP